MKERMIDTNAGRIAISESRGSGVPCLMIHGNSSCKDVFRNQVDGAIGKEFHCIAMDLPGHGNSDDAADPERYYTMRGYADIAVEVMHRLGYGYYAVLGWSLGGHVGLEMIQKTSGSQGNSLLGLMITGAPPVGIGSDAVAAGFAVSEHMHLAAKEQLSEQEVENYARATCGRNAPFDEFLRDAVARTDGRARKIMFDSFTGGNESDQRLIAEQSSIPLAVVNGTDDEFVNNEYIVGLSYQNLWHGEVHLLEGVGHAPFWETPERFDQYLREFLRELSET